VGPRPQGAVVVAQTGALAHASRLARLSMVEVRGFEPLTSSVRGSWGKPPCRPVISLLAGLQERRSYALRAGLVPAGRPDRSGQELGSRAAFGRDLIHVPTSWPPGRDGRAAVPRLHHHTPGDLVGRRVGEENPPTVPTSVTTTNEMSQEPGGCTDRVASSSGEDPRPRWQTAWYLPKSTRTSPPPRSSQRPRGRVVLPIFIRGGGRRP
jgi:hypothetical protein